MNIFFFLIKADVYVIWGQNNKPKTSKIKIHFKVTHTVTVSVYYSHDVSTWCKCLSNIYLLLSFTSNSG